MGFVRRCGILVAFFAAAACSLYSATNPADGSGADAGAEAAPPPPDVPADADAAGASDADATVDAGADGDADATVGGPNLLRNGDFETPDCADWVVGGTASMSDQTDAHGGAHACHVCGSGTVWDLHQSATASVPAGGKFVGAVWVRSGSAGANVPVQIVVAAADGSQMTALQSVGASWTPLMPPVVTANLGGNIVSMQIAAGGSACIDVDDATLSEVP